MQVVDWARIVHVKVSMDQLEHVGMLIWLNVRDQAARRVRLCQRVSILIHVAWRQQVRMNNILLIPNVEDDADEGRLLDNQIDHLLRCVCHQEGVLLFESFIADREVLRQLLVVASRELPQVPHVVECFHDSDSVGLIHKVVGDEARHGAVMLIDRGNHVGVDAAEAVR